MRKKMPQYIISTALIRSLRSYNTASLMADLKAAFVVSLVALPLSMALAIAVGLPPQHGLYTAIVAGIVAPIFGGSKFQVSGPTAAFIVILAPIVSELGLRGLIWCQILAGLFLIILGLTKTGRLVNYIPYPVTTGFTAGIAIVIATLSLKDLFGLDIGAMPDSYIQKVASLLAHIGSFKLPEFIISMLTLALIVYGGRLTKLVPSPIIAVGGATLAAIAFHKFGYADIITISDKFSYTDMLGNIVHGIPPYPPMLHIPGNDPSGLLDLPTLKELKALLSPALIIAVLAALESLLSATVADSMTGKKHDPNAELNGIGLANIFTGLFSGIPATGAIARTATNINAGAKSPLACVFHAIFVLLYMVSLSKYVSMVPMASLAALLFITAYRMSHAHQVISVLRNAPKDDKIVLLVCMLATTLIDMVAGVTLGVIIASILFMKKISESSAVQVESSKTLGRKKLAKIPEDTMLLRIQGAFFFGTAEKAFDRTAMINKKIKRLIIDLSNVSLLDITGVLAMSSMIERSTAAGIKVYVCGPERFIEKISRNIDAKQLQAIEFQPSLDSVITSLSA